MMDRATEYARQVVEGKEAACELHRLACLRHLRDLQRQNTADFPYIWRPEKSERILNFAEELTIAEGERAQPVRLYGFQHFDLGCPMGWYTLDGHRRFRRKYKSVARQNGKTFENAITAAYLMLFGGYMHGKLFAAATKHEQAKLAWDEIKRFIAVDPELQELFRVQEYKTLITALNTQCTFSALSKDRSLDDGFRSIFNSIDEIHQHRDNSVYKALYNGTRSLKDALTSMITTRGSNLNSFCYEMDEYCQNILKGVAVAEDFFVDIYTLDEKDDPYCEANWIKANPLLARTEHGLKTMRTDAATARDMGGKDLSDFMTKSMNVWYSLKDSAFVDAAALKKCASNRTLADFIGSECFVGIDLSSGGDLTTISIEIPFKTPEGRQRYYLYSHSFMPRGRFEEHIKTDIAPYDVWEKDGLITVTGSRSDFKNDYKIIVEHLKRVVEEYGLKIVEIGYDPHNADAFLPDLDVFGCPVTSIIQSARNLSAATEDIQLLIKNTDIEYDEHNRLLVWSYANAETVSNSFGEIKVIKDRSKGRYARIDPVDATIDSHVLAMRTESGRDINAEFERYYEMLGGEM